MSGFLADLGYASVTLVNRAMISRRDLTTYVAGILLLGSVSVLACWSSGHRATKVAPDVVLAL